MPVGRRRLEQVSLAAFGGLNLRDSVQEAGGGDCVDGQDFDFTDAGGVRTRDPFETVQTLSLPPGTSTAASFFVPTDNLGGYDVLLAGNGVAGSLRTIGGGTALAGPATAVASLGTGSSAVPLTYVAIPGSPVGLFTPGGGMTTGLVCTRINAVTLATTAVTMPRVNLVAAWSKQGRMAYACTPAGSATDGPTTTDVGPAYVVFSEPNLPQTVRSDAFVALMPNDGERITAMASAGDRFYVFKESKYFVFTSVTSQPAATGVGPVFNYRMIDTGIGVHALNAIDVGPQGVYWCDHGGVYACDGGEPVRVDDQLRALFVGREVAGRDLTIDLRSMEIAYAQERLYIRQIGTGALYVLDLQTKKLMAWKPYDSANKPTDFHLVKGSRGPRAKVTIGGYYTNAAAVKKFGFAQQDQAFARGAVDTGDPGEALSNVGFRYRGGPFDLGDVVRRVRQIEVHGRGRVWMRPYVDFGIEPEWLSDLTLTDRRAAAAYQALAAREPLYRAELERRALRAAKLQIEFAAAEGSDPVEIARLVLHVASAARTASDVSTR